MCCNISAATVSVSPTSSRGRRGTTDTSNPSTIDYGGPQPQSLDELARSEGRDRGLQRPPRSEEHTSELQSLMRISYAVFCLKKKNRTKHIQHQNTIFNYR